MSEYDWILDQIELYGEEVINDMIDRGYVACYITDLGWRWVLKTTKHGAAVNCVNQLRALNTP